jgi:hypothetical protein
MRQLKSVDAQFLAVESARTYGHVGGLAIYDPASAPGGDLTVEDICRLVGERLHLLPPLRWKLASVPFGLDLPYWVEDRDFDFDFHVRESSLAAEVADLGIEVTIVEPTGYSTDGAGPSSVQAERLPACAPIWEARERQRASMPAGRGNPEATGQAILDLVDAGGPPLRVFFGIGPLDIIRTAYAARIATWERWDALSREAHGAANSDATTGTAATVPPCSPSSGGNPRRSCSPPSSPGCWCIRRWRATRSGGRCSASSASRSSGSSSSRSRRRRR